MVYNLNGTTLSTGGSSGMLNVLDHGFKGDGTTAGKRTLHCCSPCT